VKKRDGRMMACVSVCLDFTRREVISAKSYRSVGIITTVDTAKPALASCRNDQLFIVDHAP
jgi:hypothetical protein